MLGADEKRQNIRGSESYFVMAMYLATQFMLGWETSAVKADYATRLLEMLEQANHTRYTLQLACIYITLHVESLAHSCQMVILWSNPTGFASERFQTYTTVFGWNSGNLKTIRLCRRNRIAQRGKTVAV